MANKVTLIWTALPNGFVDQNKSRLKLSLIATFRLTTDSNPAPANLTLADFALGNWTETVRHHSFALTFGSVQKSATVTNEFHPEMWAALFGDAASIKVAPYKLPPTDDNALSEAEMLTYPATRMGQQIEQTYMALANRKTRLKTTQGALKAAVLNAESQMKLLTDGINVYLPPDPSEKERKDVIDKLAALDAAIDSSGDKRAKALAYRDLYLGRISRSNGRDLLPDVITSIHTKISEKSGITGPGSTIIFFAPQPAAGQRALDRRTSTEFVNFHSPGIATDHSKHLPPPPSFDFHEMLTMLANYPVLMRSLGLVVDVEVDASIPTDDAVRVTHAGAPTTQPRTNYLLNAAAGTFLPKNHSNQIKNGLLDLSSGGFSIQTMDVEGVLMKHLALASNSRRSPNGVSTQSLNELTEEELAPSLRTLGVSVVFEKREEFLKKLLKAAETKSCEAHDCTFDAEDLIRGFRVDICEAETGNWYSLCERTESYKFLTAEAKTNFKWPTQGQYKTEGIVQLAVTKPEVPKSPGAADLQVLQQHESLFRWENWSLCLPFPQRALDAKRTEVKDQSAPLRVHPEFGIVDKSLPKLRFGKQYYVRCRLVDPAGNGLRKDDPPKNDFTAALGPFLYTRYEPVPPPLLLVQGEIDPDKTPGEQLHRLVVRDGDSSSSRCVVPARVAAMTAIVAGSYDSGVRPNESAFDGALLDDKGEFPQVDADDPAYRLPLFRSQPANAEPPKQPYLPDPFAVAACVGLATVNDQPVFPDAAQNDLICGFYRDHEAWPHAQPFVINLIPAGSDQPSIARLSQRTPTQPFVTMAEVALKRGEIVKLKLSSAMGVVRNGSLDTSNLEKMAFWSLWIASGNQPTPEMAHHILCGEFSLYTPPRDVVLVHAVKKPIDPGFGSVVFEDRQFGSTSLSFNLSLNLHRSSTGRAECEGKWAEPIDDPAQLVCRTIRGSAQVAEEKIELTGGVFDPDQPWPHKEAFNVKALHNFADTKHRNVAYSLRAMTRFREHYAPAPEPKNKNDFDEVADIQSREQQTYSTVFHTWNQNVLSTARPPALNLAYVIPTFRWEQSIRKKIGPESRRWGGGLRVYLERPWFTSGEGELLGVVLYSGALTGPLCEVMAPHVTQWGRDPIWGLQPHAGTFPTRELAPFPGRDDFRASAGQTISYASGLTLQALQNLNPADVGCTSGEVFRVAVAGFKPEFDQDRNLWRCDIEMNPGATYFPFVRLALARYQPDSLVFRDTNQQITDDCCLSSVVQAEFMQLTPDRWASMEYQSDQVVSLTVTGFSYQSRRARTTGDPTEGPGRVNIAIEERCKNRKGDLRWQRIPIQGANSSGYLGPDSVSHTDEGESVWKFEIRLPDSRKVRRYRVVILESEEIAQDKDYGITEHVDGSRIVYADVLGI